MAGQQAMYWQHIRQQTMIEDHKVDCQSLPSSLWGRHEAQRRDSQAMQLLCRPCIPADQRCRPGQQCRLT